MKLVALAVAACTISFAANASAASAAQDIARISPDAAESYVPGLGEIMSATQMRHAKIWFAGKAGNWELAHYELDEIREGLEDAVKFHPVFKGVPVSAMLNRLTAQPLADLDAAVAAKDRARFSKAYDNLTGACNACHQAAGHGFIVIKRPGASPFSDQAFAPKTR
jgi:hypothetical protein